RVTGNIYGTANRVRCKPNWGNLKGGSSEAPPRGAPGFPGRSLEARSNARPRGMAIPSSASAEGETKPGLQVRFPSGNIVETGRHETAWQRAARVASCRADPAKP